MLMKDIQVIQIALSVRFPSALQCSNAMQKHIYSMHKDISERPNIITKNDNSKSKKMCAFYQQPRGCKKGNSCDFSHEENTQHSLVKVPKLCQNGPSKLAPFSQSESNNGNMLISKLCKRRDFDILI